VALAVEEALEALAAKQNEEDQEDVQSILPQQEH
jgi:hypothetical protein